MTSNTPLLLQPGSIRTQVPSNARLFRRAFDDDWTADALGLLDALSTSCRTRPIVLLPDDIQAEDYLPKYEVKFGSQADRVLSELASATAGPDPDAPNLIFIDLAPDLIPGPDMFLSTLNHLLQAGWPKHLALVVVSPVTDGLHVEGFTEIATLPCATAS